MTYLNMLTGLGLDSLISLGILPIEAL